MLGDLVRGLVGLGLIALPGRLGSTALPANTAADHCRGAMLTGEVHAGEAYKASLGGKLALVLQPIPSGWILRVEPLSGSQARHDYAELATPPYQSVSPLSISTDFSFRAQDAVAWNPREFRFAMDRASFEGLLNLFQRLPPPGAPVKAEMERQLAVLLAHTATGRLRILDSRLAAGTADQWKTAAAVALHLSSTAHTVDMKAEPSALGKLEYIRFQIELDLPNTFPLDASLRAYTLPCRL